ncbi:hypothetical protein [Mycobacterium sp. pR1184]|uniref:hypothetical protein n=1 Tax=Mycobacterium sp. pR1184 TaxID=3238981 RepID=UPI00351ABF83
MEVTAVINFEVYLLMTMKPRLSLADTRGLLDARLSRVGVNLDNAARTHERIAAALSDQNSRFRDMKTLLGIVDNDATSLRYNSVLWPGFDFNAHADQHGSLASASYMHTDHTPLDVESPAQLAAWSCDIHEFDERFGPAVQVEKRPLFDDTLPAYEGYEFSWKGDRYGASFLWGLFLTSSVYWE